MNAIRVRVQGCGCAALWWIGLVTVVTAGCASWTSSIPRTEDISKKRQARVEAAVHRFDEHRNRAELEAARDRWQQGDLDGSTETLVRLLDRSPDCIEARLLLAESLLSADRPGEAISYLEPAIAARPNDARLHHMMGLLLDSMGRVEDAMIHYERAKELEPGNEVYAVSFQAAVEPDASKEMPKSLQQPAIPVQDSRSLLLQCAAIEDSVRVMDSAEAEGSSNRVTSPSALGEGLPTPPGTGGLVGRPATASELLKRGSSSMLAGQSDLALAQFREAIALEPHDPQIPITAAVSALRHNHPDVAVALLEPSREAFADSAAIRRILGTAYYRLGDYESSQVALEQALSLDKSSALSYFLMGCTLVKLGQPAVAETHFRQARTLDPRYALGR